MAEWAGLGFRERRPQAPSWTRAASTLPACSWALPGALGWAPRDRSAPFLCPCLRAGAGRVHAGRACGLCPGHPRAGRAGTHAQEGGFMLAPALARAGCRSPQQCCSSAALPRPLPTLNVCSLWWAGLSTEMRCARCAAAAPTWPSSSLWAPTPVRGVAGCSRVARRGVGWGGVGALNGPPGRRRPSACCIPGALALPAPWGVPVYRSTRHHCCPQPTSTPSSLSWSAE